MIPKYENNYDLYFEDQMNRFESFEGGLYKGAIEKTIEDIFKDYDEWLHTVLDFCCGDGTSTKIIQGLEYDVEGFDGNSRKIAVAKKNNPNIIFYELDATHVKDFTKKYDIIYASHCFEHFLNPLKSLVESKEHLLFDGGIIILILPYPNQESDGHPGSNLLKLNKSLVDVKENFESLGFIVAKIQQINFREPELLIVLK